MLGRRGFVGFQSGLIIAKWHPQSAELPYGRYISSGWIESEGKLRETVDLRRKSLQLLVQDLILCGQRFELLPGFVDIRAQVLLLKNPGLG